MSADARTADAAADAAKARAPAPAAASKPAAAPKLPDAKVLADENASLKKEKEQLSARVKELEAQLSARGDAPKKKT